MAIKRRLYTDQTPEEMKEAWQKSTRKRYHNPSKIEAREGRDRALGWNRAENWKQYEHGNFYAEDEWREVNDAGNVPRKKNTREVIEDAFRKVKKK
jgi:hypothetical protein